MQFINLENGYKEHQLKIVGYTMNKKDFETRTNIIKETFMDDKNIKCHIPTEELELDENIHQEGDFFMTEDGEFVDLEFQFTDFTEDELVKFIELAENLHEKYGKTINVSIHNKLVYFMAFTDREKSKQPNDFYLKSMRAFLKELSKANHGKIISIPLIGNNNNLSDTGFHSSEMTFESLITMINEFEIENPKSELKLKIVVLPENRADIIKTIALHTRRI